MAFIAGAIIGGAAAIGGGLLAKSASDKASKKASQANQAALDSQQAIYQQQRSDFAPFQQIGYDALPDYYRMMGITPSLTDQEQTLLDDYSTWQAKQGTPRAGFKVDPAWQGDQQALARAQAKQQMIAEWQPGTAPELSPLAKWQLQQANLAQGRADSARGLSGSGGSAQREIDTASSIAGQDYMNQYARILDALKIGSGAAGAAGGASQQFSSQIGQAGRVSADLALDKGQTEANLWQGLGQLPMDYYSFTQKQPQVTTMPVSQPVGGNPVGGTYGGSSQYGMLI